MSAYNGHHCWNCWNVSLWIGNDEGLYVLALNCLRRPRANGKPVTLGIAVNRFLAGVGAARTPDGARYTRRAVRDALEGLSSDE